MSKLVPIRFENGRPMLLGGVRLHHNFEECEDSIPGQWRQFQALGQMPGQVGKIAYGVISGHHAKGFEYLSGVEIDSFEQLPEDFGRMRIPAQYYAVFLHEGYVNSIRRTWERIVNDWLPSSGYHSTHTPDFEVYDHRFDPHMGFGDVEIWIGVVYENTR